MLDGISRKLIDPPFNLLAKGVARLGITANALTIFGFFLGLLVLIALANQQYYWALGLIVGNRFLDGLDGAVARHNGVTDLGGFFDIVGDFIFFGAVALGFALADPAQNALASAFLLFSAVRRPVLDDDRRADRRGLVHAPGLTGAIPRLPARALRRPPVSALFPP
jgi:hypothetical protein